MDPQLAADVLLGAAGAALACSGVGYFVQVLRRDHAGRVASAARALLLLGTAFQLAYVVYTSAHLGLCPMRTINLALSLGVVVLCVAYLLFPKSLKAEALGVFVVPMALVGLLASRFLGAPEVSLHLRSRLLPVHVSANVLGDAFFVLASGAAALYLLQERQLKAKRGAAFFGRVPPLDTLDRAAYRFLLLGFAFITLGAITGTLWISKWSVGTLVDVLRLLLGYATWLMFSAVLVLRAALGWRGRRAAWGTLAGFVLSLVVVFLYLGKAGMGAR